MPPTPPHQPSTTSPAQHGEEGSRSDFLHPGPLPRWPLLCTVPIAAALCLYFSVLGWIPQSEQEITPAWVIANDQGELRIADPELESMDAISQAIAQNKAAVALLKHSTFRFGVVLPVYETHTVTLLLRPAGLLDASTPPELATANPTACVRELVITHLNQQRPRDLVLEALENDVHRSQINWLNALGVALCAPLLLALCGVALNTLLKFAVTCAHNTKVHIRRRRLAAHKCPACRYSLADLPRPVSLCPECGLAWSGQEGP